MSLAEPTSMEITTDTLRNANVIKKRQVVSERRKTRGSTRTMQVLPTPDEFGPLMASAWADASFAYWRKSLLEGRLQPEQPLDVLDLMPGNGEAVWQLLQALERRIAKASEFTGGIRYLMVAPRRDLLDPLRNRPEFESYISAGILVPVLWDPDRGDPCMLSPTMRLRWIPANPVVVVAHDFWTHLEQRLCAVHYGKLLEADVSRLAQCKTPAEEAIEWKPAQPDLAGVRLDQIIREYLLKFNSAPMPLPTGAIKLIERIALLAPRGYLIVATAPGLISERHIRLFHFSDLLAHYRRHMAMPVNFYLLGENCARFGAKSWQSEIRPGMAVQLIAGNLPQATHYLAAAAQEIEAIGLCDANSLVEVMRVVSAKRVESKLDILLALLRQSAYDFKVFNAGAAGLIDAMKNKPNYDRSSWVQAFSRIWFNYLPSPQACPLHRTLAPACMRLSAWALARKMLLRGIEVYGENALDLAHMAWCEMRTGALTAAYALAKRASTIDGTDSTVREVMSTIGAKISAMRGGWLETIPSETLPLVLEPLDIGHADAFSHQYRDPQIAVMTGLQTLLTVDATRTWIASHIAERGRKPYAVIHRDHGLIGYACLSVTNSEAYFCFWIGTDFQGAGFSAEVARVLCAFAGRQGVKHIYTSAYQDNARSIASLQRSGFQRLNARALPPESDRIFFFLNLDSIPVDDPSVQLAAYYENEKLPLYFPGQESRQSADRLATQIDSDDRNPAKSQN